MGLKYEGEFRLLLENELMKPNGICRENFL